MHPLHTTSRQMEWAASNLAFNLDFIADDKLSWKPAPAAPSALEIVNHLLGVLHRIGPLVQNGSAGEGEPPNATSREQAQRSLVEAANKYGAMMRAIPTQDLDDLIEAPMGTLPRLTLATMPVMDMIHHHGQIAYIQMLLGDSETHRQTPLSLR